MVDSAAVGRDHGDAAVGKGGDAHIASAINGQRVEQLIAGQACQTTRWVAGNWMLNSTGRCDAALLHAAVVGLGPVQHGAVGRQANTVGAIDRELDLDD